MRRALVLVLLLAGCAAHRSTAPAAAPGLARDVHWVRDSAEYRAACVQTYGLAARAVEAAATGRPARSWAVVLDADETVLDNSQYQKERAALGLGFTPESWGAWVRRREAGAVPGAVAFLRRVRELGGIVAVVTNRTESECPDTRENLGALGAAFDLVLCKPDAAPTGDKEPRFDALAQGTAAPGLPPLEVVAYVGDNIRDFPRHDQRIRLEPEEALRDFGARFFVLPNPMYGSWERNPPR